MTDWCILRTSGRGTLRLAQSLTEDGFDVWTPARTTTIRKPRWNAKREVRLPLTPSFVFARAQHLADLLELEKMRVKPRRAWKNGYRREDDGDLPPHPDFSVFHWGDHIPMIADRHLEALRLEEARAVPKRKQRTYGQGQSVSVPEGSFAGMKGKVVESNGSHTIVCFGARMEVKIPTWLLREDESYSATKPATGTAAREAA